MGKTPLQRVGLNRDVCLPTGSGSRQLKSLFRCCKLCIEEFIDIDARI